MTVIVDTGPLVAVADRDDAHHQSCTDWFDNSTDTVVVPAPVIVEVCWLLGRRVGPAAEAAFLAALAGGDPRIEELTAEDYRRASRLVERYADLDLGFVDAGDRRCRTPRHRHGGHDQSPRLPRRPPCSRRRLHHRPVTARDDAIRHT